MELLRGHVHMEISQYLPDFLVPEHEILVMSPVIEVCQLVLFRHIPELFFGDGPAHVLFHIFFVFASESL